MSEETEPIDNWEITVGHIAYTVSIFPIDGKFVGSWRCPVCGRRQGCSRRTDTHRDAVDCAEEEVRTHHNEYHRKPLPSKES